MESQITENAAKKSKLAESCKFWLQKKQRFCKMTPSSGSLFCAEHITCAQNENSNLNCEDARILCPLDSSHSVFQSKLQKHLKVCNFLKHKREKYVSNNFNSAQSVELIKTQNIDGEKISDQKFPSIRDFILKAQFEKFFLIINNIHQRLAPKHVAENFDRDFSNQDQLVVTKKNKHRYQIDALISLMEKNGLLKQTGVFLEFCAGKGEFSQFIAAKTPKKSTFVLVDSRNFKQKKDSQLLGYNQNVVRLKMDIRHLDLRKIVEQETSPLACCYAKHACGVATDFCLWAISNLLLTQAAHDFGGFCIALCCHHQCEWKDFFGKEALINLLNDCETSAFDVFHVMRQISSWATCNFKDIDRSHSTDPSILTQPDNTHISGMSAAQREQMGIITKETLNFLRAEAFIEKHSLNSIITCHFYHYVPKTVTLENMALVIKAKIQPHSLN